MPSPDAESRGEAYDAPSGKAEREAAQSASREGCRPGRV